MMEISAAPFPRGKQPTLGKYAQAAICRWLSLIVLLGEASLPHAAMAAQTDTQQWSQITVNHALTPEFTASFSTRGRFDDNFSRAKDLLVRPSLFFKASEQISLGLGYDRLEALSGSGGYENRIWQQLSFGHRLAGIPFSNHLRLEQRFLDNVGNAIFRLRLRLRMDVPLRAQDWSFASFNEVFVNLNSDNDGPSSGFDQNWLFVGLVKKLSNGTKLEFGYQWAHLNRTVNRNDHALMIHIKIRTGIGSKP